MGTPINLLLVDDSQNDVDLIVSEVGQADFDPKWKRVETEAEYLAEIKKFPDIILSDYAMPQFCGLRAVQLLRESGLNIPFILISGTVGEDVAVEAMKHGATDYLLKDRIGRLGSAIRRALEEKKLIAQRQQAEDELRQSEEKFRQLAEGINEVFWMTDPAKNHVLYISPAYEKIWGRTRASVLQSPQSWLLSIHPDDRQRVGHAATTKQESGQYNEIYRIVRPDGAMRWIHDRGFPVRNAAGEVYRIAGTAEDITERKKLEENLQQSEAEFRVTFENAAIAMALVDTEGHPIKCNRALQQLLGFSEEELRRMAFMEFTHPDDVQADRKFYDELMAGQREQYQIEKRYLRKDRETVCARLTVSIVRGAAQEPIYAIAIVEDLTEKKKLEAQFLRAQRLESIGALAGGIAHDLNNVLAPIFMSCELLKQESMDENCLKLIDAIQGSAQRGAKLVKQVVSFARGAPAQRTTIHPRHLIREMADIARETFPKSISLRTDLPEDLWRLSGDATQLHQVLLNLCVNARDAMPEGGVLTIKAENTMVGTACAATNPKARAGPYVVIKTSDTGTGIPPEIQTKIFEPFFTTKETGKGTGLGLSTVLDIVKNHNGFISLNSSPGKGAEFEVWLPAHGDQSPSMQQAEEIRLPRGDAELILVIDDEAAVRTLTKQILEAYGYTVMTAANGADAITLYTRHKNEIEAVITDMMMPVMGGVTLIRALIEINPAVRVIAPSGSADAVDQAKALEAGAKKFLPKPYTVEILLTSLYEVLQNA